MSYSSLFQPSYVYNKLLTSWQIKKQFHSLVAVTDSYVDKSCCISINSSVLSMLKGPNIGYFILNKFENVYFVETIGRFPLQKVSFIYFNMKLC